ncbi:MAG: hypothetical protein WD607_08450 [Candidatus Paceibacterota bacterium]
MIKHRADAQKAMECIYMLLESHRELLSGDEIETLENAVELLEKYSMCVESEAQRDEIKSFVIEVLAFLTKVAIKIFSEE